MIRPLAMNLGILLQIALFYKAEFGQEADRRNIVGLHICFDPM
jgi:hypothetical protein